MAVKVKNRQIANGKLRASRPTQPGDTASARHAAALRSRLLFVAVLAIFGYYYIKYEHVVDERLAQAALRQCRADLCRAARGPRRPAAHSRLHCRRTFAAPATTPTRSSAPTSCSGDSIIIKPGPQSYHSTDGATIYRHRRRQVTTASPRTTAPRSRPTSSSRNSSPRSPKTRTAPSAAW